VYLWNSGKGKVIKLTDLGTTDTVTSINWSRKGNYLAVGTYKGVLQLWDYNK